jgi:hypothetical protein
LGKTLKILVVGRDNYYIYQRAFYEAFDSLKDVSAGIFPTNRFYSYGNIVFRVLGKIQTHFIIGPAVRVLNKELLRVVKRDAYDAVFLYGCNDIYPSTVKKIKSGGTMVFSYQNDDIFSDYYPKYYWRYAKKICSLVDINYVFREKNIIDLQSRNIFNGKVLRAYYIAKDNYICSEEELIKGIPDVLCLAHYEKDKRIEYLEELCKAHIKIGVPVNLAEKLDAKYSDYVVAIKNTMAPNYNRLLSSCKIPIIFLSSLNHDTYTTRCFEIPAAGAFVFCQYTDDMNSMFEDGKEAVYFFDKKDFVDKIRYYLDHDEDRIAIAKAGHQRLVKDGHEVSDRAREVYRDYVLMCED